MLLPHFITQELFMKKTLIALSVLAALSISACDSNEASDAPVATPSLTTGKAPATSKSSTGAQKLLDKTEFTEEGLLGMFAKKDAVTAIEYEALLRSIEKCEVEEKNLTLPNNCVAITAIKKFNADEQFAMAKDVDVGEIKGQLLDSNLPKLQSWLIPQMATLFGVKEEKRNFLLGVGKTATDPLLVKTLIRTLSNEMADKNVATYILSHADNKNSVVREAVVLSVTSSWSKNVDGIVDTALTFFKDEDLGVRKLACHYIGALEDEKIIEPIVAILKDREQVNIHGDCTESLYTLWYDYPSHTNTSAAAYQASVNYLQQKPRDNKFPAWVSVSNLTRINKEKIEAWKSQATYFKTDEYVALMSDIATDPDYDWLGRNAAIKVAAIWGTKNDLEAIKAKLATDTSKNASQVLRGINEAITAAN